MSQISPHCVYDIRQNKQRFIKFKSMTQLAKFCESPDTPHPWDRDHSGSNGSAAYNNKARNEWAGGSWEQAISWAKNGQWRPDGLAELVAKYDNVSIGTVQQAQLESDVIGVFPNMPAYCAGAPDTMYRLEPSLQPNRIVRLCVDRFASAAAPKETILRLAGEVFAWISSIEQHSRITAEITLFIGTNLKQLSQYVEVVVKHAGDPVDLSELAFGLMSPALLRRLEFRVCESAPRSNQTSGYGKHLLPTKKMLDGYDLYLPGLKAGSARAANRQCDAAIKMLHEFVEKELSYGYD